MCLHYPCKPTVSYGTVQYVAENVNDLCITLSSTISSMAKYHQWRVLMDNFLWQCNGCHCLLIRGTYVHGQGFNHML